MIGFVPPDTDILQFIFELIERRYDNTATIFCTQYPKKAWHSRLGEGIHDDSIMDRIVHNAAWVFAGAKNMRDRQLRQTLIKTGRSYPHNEDKSSTYSHM
ncbi:MAG: ATP-binding protein [Candidatus Ornithomonoglobus sp.]